MVVVGVCVCVGGGFKGCTLDSVETEKMMDLTGNTRKKMVDLTSNTRENG